MSWQQRALCRDDRNPDRFFPLHEESARRVAQTCEPCPVRGECLGFAMTHQLDGVWGGTTTAERVQMGARPRSASVYEQQEIELRRLQVAALTRAGLTGAEIAARLGMSHDAYLRARARGRLSDDYKEAAG